MSTCDDDDDDDAGGDDNDDGDGAFSMTKLKLHQLNTQRSSLLAGKADLLSVYKYQLLFFFFGATYTVVSNILTSHTRNVLSICFHQTRLLGRVLNLQKTKSQQLLNDDA